MKGRPSITKRTREKERADRKLDKADRRDHRREVKAKSGPRDDGVDPDIAGIIPGPQKLDPSLFGVLAEADDSPV